MDIPSYWNACLRQQADGMKAYFHPDAEILWPNTNERFTVAEFIRANCEYPGEWDGEIEKLMEAGSLAVTAVHVYSADRSLSFHVVSFLEIQEDRLARLTEYWGDDGPPPQWRQELGIGSPIHSHR